jgi:hypothetical protein
MKSGSSLPRLQEFGTVFDPSYKNAADATFPCDPP